MDMLSSQFWSRLAKLSWRPFEEAREFVHSLKLKNQKEWQKYCQGNLAGKRKKPEDIPTNPNVIYRNQGWTSYGDWLGTGTVAARLRQYRPFKEARRFVHSLGLKSQHERHLYCQGKISIK